MDADQKMLLKKLPPVEGATMAEKDDNAVHAQTLSKKYPLDGGGSVQARAPRQLTLLTRDSSPLRAQPFALSACNSSPLWREVNS